jgi:hypothetical protein
MQSNQEILRFINLANQQYETSSGNCGVFAIALHQLFGEGEFLVVENDVEPEKCYHVAYRKDGIIYDGTGVIESEEELLCYGFDEVCPDSLAKVQKLPASESFYRWIDRGTDHSQKPEDFIALIQKE